MADLNYHRGTTYGLTFNYFPAAETPDGETCLFTVKSEIDNDITDLELDILVPKNIAMTDNTCNIIIEPDDVGMEHEKGNYVWDIKVVDADGQIYPIISGKFKLDVTATNRITV